MHKWKRRFKRFVISHARRTGLELLNIFINHDFLFKVVGLINKRVKLIGFVFMVYPANEEYALKYVYRHRLPHVRWDPWPSGILWQDGKIGIMFCVAATNEQFINSENNQKLKKIVDRMEQLRILLQAESKTFAGIVPGVLARRNIRYESTEAELTSLAVVQAIDFIRTELCLEYKTPIIILGGKGFIGRRVFSLLETSNVYSIDSQDCQNENDWPDLGDKKPIVVNITVKAGLKNYLDVIPHGSVVLNEVYPEPSRNVLNYLKEKNCSCWHVVGVRAKAFPSFPKAYRGAIPCCAAWLSEEMEVVVRKLN